MNDLIFIDEPTECPCCSFKLIKINEQLFCKNISCSAQVNKKVEHFAKTLGIKGLGPKTVASLELESILDIYYLDFADIALNIGNTLAKKLVVEIENSKSSDIALVLEAMSIPLVGKTAANKLAKFISTLDDITEKTCKDAGLGAKVTENLLLWRNFEYLELREFLPFTFKNKPLVSQNSLRKVCITGKLKSFKKKADAEDILAKHGFLLVDSVTKDTEYLIDESESTSSKREKAVQYGIKIITDLNDLLKENIK